MSNAMVLWRGGDYPSARTHRSMRRDWTYMGFKNFGIALAALTLAACSTPPRESSGSAPAAAAQLAPAAALAATAEPAAANGKTPVLNRKLVAAGYRATTIKGEVYYCRMVEVTNTNFKKRVCLNEAQLRDEERKAREMQDRMINTEASPSCMGPTCAGG